MAIVHVVRCDAGGCANEAPLMTGIVSTTVAQWETASIAGQSVTYSVPGTWKQVDYKQFCSWTCVATYASGQESRP